MKMTEGLHYCSNASTAKTKQGRIPTGSKLGMSKVVSNDNHNQNWNRLEMEIKFAIIFEDTAQMLDMIVVTLFQANPNDGETRLNS